MKKLPILLLLVFFYSAIAYGQEDKLKKIKTLYADTNDKIAKSKLPNEDGWGNLYSTEVLVNSNNGSWRACGNYTNKIVFWYNDQPGFQEEQDKPDNSVLVKIEIKTSCAALTFSEEYLYDQGKLVFCFKTDNLGDKSLQEFRYYFADGKLFRYQENQDVLKDISKVGVDDLIKKSEKLTNLFIQTFN